MNTAALKSGLRHLADRGWNVVILADDCVEFLCEGEGENPLKQTKVQFLLRFRDRMQGAIKDKALGAIKHGNGDHGR